MAVIENPILKRFVDRIGKGLTLAQVVIRRTTGGYELRHVADEGRASEALRLVEANQARALAQFTAAGAFRPLKSAPNLQMGWRILAADEGELETALNQLYPGAIADWHAAQQANPPVTHFREFTERQSGMYRITTKLDDAQAAQVIRACCAGNFCLKQRLWTVTGLATDTAAEPSSPTMDTHRDHEPKPNGPLIPVHGRKSLIPCLEPCAVLLELARKAVRIEQQEKVQLELAPGDVATIHAALAAALAQPEPGVREADFSAPQNSRRVQLVLEKLQPVSELAGNSESE
jgi:hypothetical protein